MVRVTAAAALSLACLLSVSSAAEFSGKPVSWLVHLSNRDIVLADLEIRGRTLHLQVDTGSAVGWVTGTGAKSISATERGGYTPPDCELVAAPGGPLQKNGLRCPVDDKRTIPELPASLTDAARKRRTWPRGSDGETCLKLHYADGTDVNGRCEVMSILPTGRSRAKCGGEKEELPPVEGALLGVAHHILEEAPPSDGFKVESWDGILGLAPGHEKHRRMEKGGRRRKHPVTHALVESLAATVGKASYVLSINPLRKRGVLTLGSSDLGTDSPVLGPFPIVPSTGQTALSYWKVAGTDLRIGVEGESVVHHLYDGSLADLSPRNDEAATIHFDTGCPAIVYPTDVEARIKPLRETARRTGKPLVMSFELHTTGGKTVTINVRAKESDFQSYLKPTLPGRMPYWVFGVPFWANYRTAMTLADGKGSPAVVNLAAAGKGAAAEEAAVCALASPSPAMTIGSTIPTTVHESLGWVKGTTWFWNSWQNVTFMPDGNFNAPTPECQTGHCHWASTETHLHVHWGDAGLHTMKVNRKKNRLRGSRFDGDDVRATLNEPALNT